MHNRDNSSVNRSYMKSLLSSTTTFLKVNVGYVFVIAGNGRSLECCIRTCPSLGSARSCGP
jgi:hypothetical protein